MSGRKFRLRGEALLHIAVFVYFLPILERGHLPLAKVNYTSMSDTKVKLSGKVLLHIAVLFTSFLFWKSTTFTMPGVEMED